MNICFFESDMSKCGGTSRVTANLINELAHTTDYNISVLSAVNEKKRSYFDLDIRVRHDVLSINQNQGKKDVLCNIFKLIRYIEKNKIDILINVGCNLGIYSLPARMICKFRLITWEHFNYFEDVGFRYTHLIRKISIKLCTHYIVLTDQDKLNFKENLKKTNKVRRIYNPMNEVKVIEQINKENIILSVGALTQTKGFDMAIEVAKKVFRKHPDWKWYICGEGPEREELQKTIIKYGLEKNMYLIGQVSNVNEYYQKSRIYVMTSRHEGLPMTLLEAKAYRLPLISFNIMTGPNEIINDNINGYLIKPYDIEMMIEKINTLIEEEKLINEFSNQSIIGNKKFCKTNIIDQWINVFES